MFYFIGTMQLVYALIATGIVSLLAWIGILTLSIRTSVLRKFLLLFISFSAGTLFGDVVFHLFPEIIEWWWFSSDIALSVLWWIMFALITEKVIRRNHCHLPITKTHVHSFAYMNLVGDAIHNLIDGIIIWASFLVSIPLGVATTIAVIFHEIPQEIGDFGVLVHGWFSPKKALIINFLTALTALFGVILVFWLHAWISDILPYILWFAAWTFIYIAWSDLIPELHKETKISQSLLQVFFFVFGIWVMAMLLLFE